eukprot:gb/GEZN01000464.1/.p1 GENE.gb/GEZN01000464.1/~~gb/GEZN01000464.1/.p1  ORF type:complete len:1212 (+),score=253.97 gb/GEZN01000464.1/:643-4278(+)
MLNTLSTSPKRKTFSRSYVQRKKDGPFETFTSLNATIAGAPLDKLLKLPVARLPQYLMYFAHIYMNLLHPDSEDGQVLAKAVRGIQNVADQIAQDQKKEASKQQVVALQTLFKGIVIVEPHRFFVKKGAMKRIFDKNAKNTKGKQPKVYLFVLFNDFLMYGSPRKSKLIKHAIRVEGLQVAQLPDMQGEWQNALSIQSRIKDNIHGIWICCASSPKAKEKWLEVFQDVINARQQELMREGARLPKEIISCADFENQVMGKKVRRPKMVPRPDNPIEIKKQREEAEAKEKIRRAKQEEEDAARRKLAQIEWAEAEIRNWEMLRQQSLTAQYAEAVYEFRATVPEAHSLSIGQVVIIVEKHATGWWKVKLAHEGHVAVVPYNYLAATEKVIPFNVQPPRQAIEILSAMSEAPGEQTAPTATKPSGQAVCGDCESQYATYFCGECGLSFCDSCNEKFHKRGQRKRHVREKLAAATAAQTAPRPVPQQSSPQLQLPDDDLDTLPTPPPQASGASQAQLQQLQELQAKVHALTVEVQEGRNAANLLNLELANSKKEAARDKALHQQQLSLMTQNQGAGTEEALRREQELHRAKEEAEHSSNALLQQAETQKAALAEKVKRLESQRQQDKQLLSELEAATREGSAALDLKKAEMDAARKMKELEMEQELTNLREATHAYDLQLTQLQQQLAAEQRELRRAKEDADAERQKLSAEIHELEVQMKGDAIEVEAKLEQQSTAHKRMILEKDTELSQVKSTLSGLEKQLNALNDERKGIAQSGQAVANQLREQIQQLQSQAAQLEQEKSHAMLSLEQVQSQALSKEKSLQVAWDGEKLRLDKKVAESERRCEELDRAIQAKENTIAELVQTVQEAKQNIKDLSDKLRFTENESEKAALAHKTAVTSLQVQIQQAESLMEHFRKQKEAEAVEIQHTIRELRDQLENSEESCKVLQAAFVAEQKANMEKMARSQGERVQLEGTLASTTQRFQTEVLVREKQILQLETKLQELALQLEKKLGELRTAAIEMDRLTDDLDAEKKALHFPPLDVGREIETSNDGKYTLREWIFWQVNGGAPGGPIKGLLSKPEDYIKPIPIAPPPPPMAAMPSFERSDPSSTSSNAPALPSADMPKISANMLQGGSKLLKKKAPTAARGGGDILSDMKNAKLRKVGDRQLAAPTGEVGLMGALQNSLNDYRKFVSMEGGKESDDEDDRAFGDDEWE